MIKLPKLGITALATVLLGGLLVLGSIAQAAETAFKLPTAGAGGDSLNGGCCPPSAALTDTFDTDVSDTSPEAAGIFSVDVNEIPGSIASGCQGSFLNVSRLSTFRNFGFGVPSYASISSIDVLLDDAYATHNQSTSESKLTIWRVWLSWDNGTSWTDPQDTPTLTKWERPTTNSSDHALNSPALWGHPWTGDELVDSQFVLRIQACTEAPDLGSGPSSGVDAFLDSIQVKVTYSAERTVTVYKQWTNIDGPAVSVSLVCDDAAVTPSSALADDGAPAVFTVTGAATSCTATEAPLPSSIISTSGYCSTPITGGSGSCTIANTVAIPDACSTMTFDKLILGTSGADTLSGTGLRELIYGLESNDTIYGGAGNDCLVGGTGNDSINGGSGNDKLLGEAGNDTLKGDSGTDSANGGTNTDSCDAESETSCES